MRSLKVISAGLVCFILLLWAPAARSQTSGKEVEKEQKIGGTVWRVPFHRGKKQWTVTIKFSSDGTCVYQDYKRCGWSQNGASVIVTMDKSDENCPAVWNATLDGDTLEATVHQRTAFSCQAATYDITLYRSR